MKDLIKYIMASRRWFLIPFLFFATLAVLIGIVSMTPFGAFVYTIL